MVSVNFSVGMYPFTQEDVVYVRNNFLPDSLRDCVLSFDDQLFYIQLSVSEENADGVIREVCSVLRLLAEHFFQTPESFSLTLHTEADDRAAFVQFACSVLCLLRERTFAIPPAEGWNFDVAKPLFYKAFKVNQHIECSLSVEDDNVPIAHCSVDSFSQQKLARWLDCIASLLKGFIISHQYENDPYVMAWVTERFGE